jgi:glutamate-ammonia-ligase adenylyltransferase
MRALESWIAQVPGPSLYAEELAIHPEGRRRLIRLLGVCGQIGRSFQQNPELGLLVLEDELYRRDLNPAELKREGELLFHSSRSYSHGLDRLRFLKQKWISVIVSQDLDGSWPQPKVWRALSDLADVILGLATPWVWRHIAPGADAECPVAIVAFGKHGGREVNYSSDIDVIYVLDDGADEQLERLAIRFCETFGRAIEDSMGRGSLYRVDLKLRPYGGTGPIVNRFRAYRAYYELYAEPWEVQALIRSRTVVGSSETCAEWEKLRLKTCFERPVSEFMLDQLLEMRGRIESSAGPSDIKRGQGGIRDIEFACQILHLTSAQNVTENTTLDVLDALFQFGLLQEDVYRVFYDQYIWLRKLEHRLQFAEGRQTHEVPDSSLERLTLARLMGLSSADEFTRELDERRQLVSDAYRKVLPSLPEPDRTQVLQIEPKIAEWFDGLPESDGFYRQLLRNKDSLARVLPIVTFAPKLVQTLRSSVSVTEAIVSGEVLEESVVVPTQFTLEQLPSVFRDAYLARLSRFAIGHEPAPLLPLTQLAEAAIQIAAATVEYSGSIIALGSLGRQEMGPGSDADILFLVADRQLEAEERAQEMFRLMQNWRQRGLPLEVDSRLRPDGNKGLLVRTYNAFDAYAASDMEDWERFALGNARLAYGDQEALSHVLAAARLETESIRALDELLAMKVRIEEERVPEHLRTRNVKLGYGGLSDIEWTVRLAEMMRNRSRLPQDTADLESRIKRLVRFGIFNTVEGEILTAGLKILVDVRMRLALAGFPDDLVPENPDKLNLLAGAMGQASGNDFIRQFSETTSSIRSLYLDTVARLASLEEGRT